MGCDIHFNVEQRQADGSWEEITTGKNYTEFYEGRNYSLFALLADVRNSEDTTPISEPRGLPHDVSESVRKERERWDCDAHSVSFLTLKELKDYNWAIEKIKYSGWVPEPAYRRWKTSKSLMPDMSCGDVYGNDVVKIEEKDYNLDAPASNVKSCYIYCEWENSAESIDGYFTTKTIPAMENLMVDNDPESVRAVFWFDN